MQFATLEDERGLLETVLFPRAYAALGDPVTTPGPYVVEGRVDAQAPASGPTRVASATCAQDVAPRGGRPRVESGERREGNAAARRAAQRALAFLGQEVSRWQEQNRCYGCHVQAVTLEALSVGRSNGYEVPERHMRTVLEGMLTLPGGARAAGGLSYHVSSLLEPSNAFGGSAFARYDELVDGSVSLIAQQATDGGWGLGGASRGTAMWAVLGLVSIDVASIELTGVADGQHLSTARDLRGVAVDNEQRRVVRT